MSELSLYDLCDHARPADAQAPAPAPRVTVTLRRRDGDGWAIYVVHNVPAGSDWGEQEVLSEEPEL